MAANDSSGLVRLVLASLLQRMPLGMRPALAGSLMAREGDALDHNLPKLLSYGLAPLVERDPVTLAQLASQGQFPLTREWITRGLAEDPAKNADALSAILAATVFQSEAVRADVLRGLAAGLAGRHKVAPPAGWAEFAASLEAASAEVTDLVRNLSVVFGDGRALDEVRRLVLDNDAEIPARRSALEALIEARPDDLREVCEKVLRVRFLNATALKGLTLFDDDSIGQELARSYSRFHPSERAAVIETLVTRPNFARAAVGRGRTRQDPGDRDWRPARPADSQLWR